MTKIVENALVGTGKEIAGMVPGGPFDSDGMMAVEIARLVMAHVVAGSCCHFGPQDDTLDGCLHVWGVEGVGQGLHRVMTVVSQHWWCGSQVIRTLPGQQPEQLLSLVLCGISLKVVKEDIWA
jgi:hypothetical protein